MKRRLLVVGSRWIVAAVVVGTSGWARAGGRDVDGVLNLNTAPQELLSLLPGVGPAKARGILIYRARHPFRTVDELVRVKGIGRRMVRAMRAHLATAGPSTIHPVAPNARLPPIPEAPPVVLPRSSQARALAAARAPVRASPLPARAPPPAARAPLPVTPGRPASRAPPVVPAPPPVNGATAVARATSPIARVPPAAVAGGRRPSPGTRLLPGPPRSAANHCAPPP